MQLHARWLQARNTDLKRPSPITFNPFQIFLEYKGTYIFPSRTTDNFGKLHIKSSPIYISSQGLHISFFISFDS